MMLAGILEQGFDLPSDRVVDRLRDADDPRIGEALQAGGDVDAIPDETLAVDDDI
jgi:hypothetical protein